VFRTGHLFDEGLRSISRRLTALIEACAADVVLVELARGSPGPPIDVSYQRALNLIDRRVWQCSTVFRLGVPTPTQLERNRVRREYTGRGTPDEVMHNLYADDSPESFVDAGIPVTHLSSSFPPRVTAAQVLRLVGVRDWPHDMWCARVSGATRSASQR
jgi:hypothetical protein